MRKTAEGTRISCTAGLILLAALLTAGCASRRGTPKFPGAVAPTPPAPSMIGAEVADTAIELEGTPYRNAGTDPSGFDCSGLVQFVFAQHGVALPRSVREQFQSGLAVARDSLAAGDLVFFSTTAPGPTHVGIVIRDDWFVHAPSERGVVRAERLDSPYWSKRYVGARRVLPE